MSFNCKNFSKQNTPEQLQRLGNACLIISLIGATILTFPTHSATLQNIAPYIAFIGSIGKALTKCFGT